VCYKQKVRQQSEKKSLIMKEKPVYRKEKYTYEKHMHALFWKFESSFKGCIEFFHHKDYISKYHGGKKRNL
jgi:hypothetical protein